MVYYSMWRDKNKHLFFFSESHNEMQLAKYSHAPHNDVSVNDGPHIRRWSHNIIIFTFFYCYTVHVVELLN